MKILVENSARDSDERLGFFARQFAQESTKAQNTFDVIFGVVGPVLCFYFDPIVFNGGMPGLGSPMLSRLQLITYAISLIQIPVLLAWLLLGRHMRSFSAPIGGVLLAGAVFCFLIGVLILPYSVIGLVVLIGVFGFTPFVTAFVYLRNACRAIVGQQQNQAFASRFLTATLAGLLSVGLPVLADRLVNDTLKRSTEWIISGDAKQAEQAVNQISWMPFIPQESLDRIITAYRSSNDPERRASLRRSFRTLTGDDIERRIMILD